MRKNIKQSLLSGTSTDAKSAADAIRERLDEHEKQNIRLNSFISLAEESGSSSAPAGSGPLAGLSLAIKDNIDTAGELGCSAGSLALKDLPVNRDAFLVQKLRDAGAIITGKTNLSEWANFRSTNSMSGWSSAGGQTRNPYVLDRSPCGSSSGSAVAVAAGYVSAAVGTETDGSIICPSASNGIVGIKPTRGRVSRSGIVPIAESQDTAGPMANNVADAALLLSCMDGEDTRDPATMVSQRSSAPDLMSFLGLKDLKGMRLGYYDGGETFIPQVKTAFHNALTVFEEAGAELRNIGSLSSMDQLSEAEMTVLLCEFRDDISQYFQDFRNNDRFSCLSDLIVYNMDNRKNVMPYFGQELFYMASETKGRADRNYRGALETSRRLALTDGLELMFREYRLDALIMPSNNPSWVIDPVLGDYGVGGTSSLAAVSGWPSITLPMTTVFGLPVGLSLVSRAWDEARVIGIADYFERGRPDIPEPRFLSTLDFKDARRY